MNNFGAVFAFGKHLKSQILVKNYKVSQSQQRKGNLK